MKIVGHCRFSYFGRTDTGRDVATLADAEAKLWNAERMAVRFHLFERILLPSIAAQTDPGFSFVVTCSEAMPAAFHDRLEAALDGIAQARILRTAETEIGRALKPVMVEASNGRQDPAVHFRVDDDDALAVDYIARLRAAAAGLRPSTMITFPAGVMGFLDAGRGCHRAFHKHAIAIGLALVKAPADTRTPFQIQHRAYAQSNPVYADPTFPAWHYTRHTTNNTNGYDRVIHRDGGVVDIVAENSRKVHPEFAEGAVTTPEAEAILATAFPHTTGEALRAAIEASADPHALMAGATA